MKNSIQILPGIKALIFDCDGTLADTMPIHMNAWKEALLFFDAPYHFNFIDKLKGMPEDQIVVLYNKEFNTNLNPQAVVEQKHIYFRKEAHHVKPITPVYRLVIQNKGLMPMAVVSGGLKSNVHFVLEMIGIKDIFDTIITADDRIKPKPAPDIFLESAARMNVAPHYCQVFEDGDVGIEAARLAGMKVTDVRLYI
jgi:HAD superfamily hydrolase (TIGR01509 family)